MSQTPVSPKVGFISLGCPKALVDSERILTELKLDGYDISPDYDGADLVVVNTCGFIDDAKRESMDAIREVGPGGHYLGCAHTQANFKTAFWRSDLLDYKPFETWAEEGERDTEALAALRVSKLLAQYEEPPLDPAIREALDGYIAEKKAKAPAVFG